MFKFKRNKDSGIDEQARQEALKKANELLAKTQVQKIDAQAISETLEYHYNRNGFAPKLMAILESKKKD